MGEISESNRLNSRRRVLWILAAGGAAGLAWRFGLFGRSGPQLVTRTRTLMGTIVNLTVVGDDREAAGAAVEATLSRMAELEALLSRYRPDSEVSRLNRTGSVEDASDALLRVLELADRINDLGDGGFDVTVEPVLALYRNHLATHQALPQQKNLEQTLDLVGQTRIRTEGRRIRFDRRGMGITLDGIGKGYIVDEGVAVLKERGFHDVLVEAGGDLVASGGKGSGAPWRVGIRSPRPGLELQARFEARDRAVATSGDYMQPFTADYSRHHILDPRNGFSSPELASSTVIASTAAMADGLATLTMVVGPRRSLEILEETPDCEGYLMTKGLEIVKTSGFSVV